MSGCVSILYFLLVKQEIRAAWPLTRESWSNSLGTHRWRQHTSAYVSIRQHTVSIRQHTSALFSIRQHTSAYVSICPDPQNNPRSATDAPDTSDDDDSQPEWGKEAEAADQKLDQDERQWTNANAGWQVMCIDMMTHLTLFTLLLVLVTAEVGGV